MLGKLAIVSAISVLAVSTAYAQNMTNGAGAASGWSNNQNNNALSGGTYYDPEVGKRQMDEQVRRESAPDGWIHPAPSNNAPITGTLNASGIH